MNIGIHFLLQFFLLLWPEGTWVPVGTGKKFYPVFFLFSVSHIKLVVYYFISGFTFTKLGSLNTKGNYWIDIMWSQALASTANGDCLSRFWASLLAGQHPEQPVFKMVFTL